MKKSTEKKLRSAETVITRSFIDRKRKVDTAVLEDSRNILKESNSNVTLAYLYGYYVSICQIPSWDLTNDFKVAKQVGLSERKVADSRRKLTKMGWIRFDTHTYLGVKYGLWYIGKEVVAMKMGIETSLEEFCNAGIITDEEYAQLEGREINE